MSVSKPTFSSSLIKCRVAAVKFFPELQFSVVTIFNYIPLVIRSFQTMQDVMHMCVGGGVGEGCVLFLFLAWVALELYVYCNFFANLLAIRLSCYKDVMALEK